LFSEFVFSQTQKLKNRQNKILDQNKNFKNYRDYKRRKGKLEDKKIFSHVNLRFAMEFLLVLQFEITILVTIFVITLVMFG
jgi:hypothetical protein